MLLESRVEKHLQDEVAKRGGLCLKFVSPGTSGVPDRIVMLPEGLLFFVELKRPGKSPRPLQLFWHRLFEKLGHQVLVLDSIVSVDAWLYQVDNFKGRR